MSFNDRCREAEYALRKGVPLEDTPELRAGLISLLSSMAEGWVDTADLRDAISQINQRATDQGIDYWSDTVEHIDARWAISRLGGEPTTVALLGDLGMAETDENVEALHLASKGKGFGQCRDGRWRDVDSSAEVRSAEEEGRPTESAERFLARRKG